MESQPNPAAASGQLFIVATPIGNLADITYRAVEVLKSVDVIAAEDTRTSRTLLNHYGIGTPMIAVHEHNEERMAAQLLERLRRGEDIALISDAGTPLISDPGYRLVRKLRAEGIRITPIPGPSSILAALCSAGLPTDSFTYHGFLPRSGKGRKIVLQHIAVSSHTTILLESPNRLLDTLQDLATAANPAREACVARELTKHFETILTAPLAELIDHFEAAPPRGECVILIGPNTTAATEATDDDILARLNKPDVVNLPPSARAKTIAEALGIPKSRVYRLLLDQD